MRIKEQLKKTDENLNHNPSFEEWLNYFSKESTSEELDDMEKSYKNKPQNNPYYQPLRGA